MLLSSLTTPSRERAMVLRWKDEVTRYGTRREQRQKILDAIREGYDTLIEIQAETRIPRSTCYKILRRLEQENLITKTLTRLSRRRDEFRFEINTAK